MLSGSRFLKQHAVVMAVGLAWVFVGQSAETHTTAQNGADLVEERLAHGECITDIQDGDRCKYVTGRIIIDESPDRVWPIMTNPFEFQGKISPRMKSVEVVEDKVNTSVLRCTVDVCFPIPSVTYTVKSTYRVPNRIEFHRIGGILRDFRGYWYVKSISGGLKSEVTYAMYIDPGFFVPQWIMREGVKMELPRTLTALRERIDSVYEHNQALEHHTILAATASAQIGLAPRRRH